MHSSLRINKFTATLLAFTVFEASAGWFSSPARLAGSTAAKATAPAPLPDIAWWKYNGGNYSNPGGPTDFIHGNNLIAQSSITGVTSPNGGAYSSGNYSTAANNAVFNQSTGAWSFWFNTTTTVNFTALMSRCDPGGSPNGIVIVMLTGGQVVLQVKDNGGNDTGEPASGSGYNDSHWHHLVFTWSQSSTGTNYLYLDGSLAGAVANTRNWAFNNQNLYVAGSQDTFWAKFTGSLADVRFYSYQVSAAQAAAIYNAGAQ